MDGLSAAERHRERERNLDVYVIPTLPYLSRPEDDDWFEEDQRHEDPIALRNFTTTMHPALRNEQNRNEDLIRTKATTSVHTRRARIQLGALFWSMFLAGWSDATFGPLLPRIQEFYHVNDTIVSFIFVSQCLGFVVGASIMVPLLYRFGFGKTIVLGAILHMFASGLQAASLSFPVFVLSCLLAGIGVSFQDTGGNAYVANLRENVEIKMGLLHAAYGIGALTSPLVATQFARFPGKWHYHFLCALVIGCVATIALSLTFKFKKQEDCLADIGQLPDEPTEETLTSAGRSFKQILMHKNVHLLSLFTLIYVGIEVTIGGWIVTYILRLRDGGANSGYISSGFFGGLTFGRVGLLWLNAKIGDRYAMYLYAVLAIGLELVVWLVPSLIGSGVSIALVGVLLGPMYPIVMNHAGRILPRWLLTGAVGWVCGFGQSGAALLPFLTGALAGKFGIGSLQPVLVAMMVTMILVWTIVPGGPRKVD
ncbi:hypothetical protein Moror_15373 [Moniliophthora roreri MCA 2997]|uniref:Major facilitator superfamily (MFS) profile domain-containing protein n=1 Tax=Moniliophthora roreri (strain MCA 2997) TaxID=1381753 RepID=V2WLQ9_MONRO|nr:hypothetical protein Moror_15373 [Moniliophthora roreri MCA 2997]